MKKRKDLPPFEEDEFGKRLELSLALSLLFLIVIFTTVKSAKVESSPIRLKIASHDTVVQYIVVYDYAHPPKPLKPPTLTQTDNGIDNTNATQDIDTVAFTSEWEDDNIPLPSDNSDENAVSFMSVEIQPQLVKRVIPEYPELARRAGLEGTVYLKAVIDTTGHVRSVAIMRSDNEIFNQAAIEAVKQFIFKPAIQNGRKVTVWISIPVKFVLER